MTSETIQIKYKGDSAIRFAAIDASFVGIINPGDIFSVSKLIYDLELAIDPRYEVVTTKTKTKKIESEG